ncbi:MAG: hypothetical protein GF349_03300 [Candidatus Magasanikbacteria bacterium]|nr:hypothetical protein [Candidatus Magasanikbacteria bacterium]
MKKINFSKIPTTPGVYFFYNDKKNIIYVGKASSLRSRIKSYFSGKSSNRPIEDMFHEVKDVKWQSTDSVLEAVIAEANFIKKYKPKYNVLGKDDKSWNYIAITKDEYPQVVFIREHELKQLDKKQMKNFKHLFGPFPGLNTKMVMKILSKLFNISSCKPGSKRPCLYYEMGQCLGVCINEIDPKNYKQKVISPLVMFLRGNKKNLIKNLEQKMDKASKDQEYEEAARLRNQIKALQRIQDIALLNIDFFKKPTNEDVRQDHIKIEGYDISNLGASGKVGSMVVFVNAEPDKYQYRKFKIKTIKGQSDVDCLEEVIRRRLKHSVVETNGSTSKKRDNASQKNIWPLPNLFLIDGGKPQVNRVKKILKEKNINIPVVGIAKGPKRKKNEFILGSKKKDLVEWVNKNQKILIQVRDEAHRFAVSYQRKLRKGRI